jgi:hypothetical protein
MPASFVDLFLMMPIHPALVRVVYLPPSLVWIAETTGLSNQLPTVAGGFCHVSFLILHREKRTER